MRRSHGPLGSPLLSFLLVAAGAAAAGAVAAADAGQGSSAAGQPMLMFLGLRCGRRPVSLEPAFSASWFNYRATLDFASGELAVDVLPAPGSEVTSLARLETIKQIAPGETHRIEVSVHSTSQQAVFEPMTYTIAVSRLAGTESKLRALAFTGESDPPVFDPDLLEYVVVVPAEQDRLGLQFQPWDSGQTFEVKAVPALVPAGSDAEDEAARAAWMRLPSTSTTTPAPTSTTLHPPADKPMAAPDGNPFLAPRTEVVGFTTTTVVGGLGRRLRLGPPFHDISLLPPNPSGEMQQNLVTRWFPMAADEPRLVTITVLPANGDGAQSRVYRLRAAREPCPIGRPVFAPDLGACAVTCNDGYFRNLSSGQCEGCARHCLRCSGWADCSLCEPSRWRSLRFVRLSQGYCKVVHVPWRLILLGLAVAASVLGLASCCPIRAPPPERKGVALHSAWQHRFAGGASSDSGGEEGDKERLLRYDAD